MNNAVTSNPFYQPARQWQIRIFTQREDYLAIENAFDDIALSISSFEIDEALGIWRIEIITDTQMEQADLDSRLALISGLMDISTPQGEIEEVENRNWQAEVEKSFPPLEVGRFFVHGSHVDKRPTGKITLEVNAGAAFGSGEHATTSGCLLALSRIAKRRHFARPLDMGCGSGILAIAAAKLFHCHAIGTDIDPVSVIVARENAVKNKVSHLTQFAAGDGYRLGLVRKSGPYDLILANILARPLIKMAPQLAANLAPGGIAILSGLLDFQARRVIHAHKMQGLILRENNCHNHWCTLVLQKG